MVRRWVVDEVLHTIPVRAAARRVGIVVVDDPAHAVTGAHFGAIMEARIENLRDARIAHVGFGQLLRENEFT